MSEQPFDSVSRRLALALFGAAGLTAAGRAAPARAGQKAKSRKPARKKCQSQGLQCDVVFARHCSGPECATRQETCCSLAAACDFAGFMDCFFSPFGNGT